MHRTRSDSGYALVTAVMTMGVATSLILVMIGYAIQAGNDSGRFRQRTIAVNAAEAVVDAAYAGLQSSQPNNLPCSWPRSGNLDVATQPRTQVAQATIVYTFRNGSTGCPNTSNFKEVVSALITAKATTQAGAGSGRTRYMQSNVVLTPVYDGLDKAIFANGGLTADNQAQINGNLGTDADVYSNGNFTCSNNFDVAGSLLVQGSITLTTPCSVGGDVWAKGDVTTSNRSIIGGRVLSSQGSVNLSGNTGVTGTILAKTTISWSGCSTSSKCFPGATVPDPAAQVFPPINWDSAVQAAWAAAGYDIITDKKACNGKDETGGPANKNPSKWLTATLKSGGSGLGQKTLLWTDCSILLENAGILRLDHDLAIFSEGGFQTTGRVIFQSTGGPRNLHWVVPFKSTGYPSGLPLGCTRNITTENQFATSSQVLMLAYTPCTLTFSNNSRHVGQVYGGGSVSLKNRFNLDFRPVPVFGTTFSNGSIKNYKVEILYKRENAG
jgi:Tfp pilus assembly protein PilX